MKEKYGFVYIYRDRKHKRYYIGCHWGYEDDGYICSSRWMRRSYKRRKENFKRRILTKIYSGKHDLLNEEYRWLQMIKPEELGKKYYNLKIWRAFDWYTDENKKLVVGEKISKKLKEFWKNDEEREKQSILMKKISNLPEVRQNMSNAHKGKIQSEETKEKRAKKLKGHSFNKGKKRTEEQKQNMKNSFNCPEVKERRIESHKGQKAWNKGKKTGKQSEETIKKRTEALNRPEVKEKRSNAMKGKPAWNKGIKQTQKWFNNGIIEIFISFDEKPDDFIVGRLKRK